MGGDFAPAEVVRGALLALRQHADLNLILAGDEAAVRREIGTASVGDRVQVVHAPDVIGMSEAASALRKKKDASIVRAMDQVREGQAQAVVAAGSTGAAMSAALLRWGRIKGIERPAIAAVLPTAKGPCVVLDVGANVDCHPDWLVQFAWMGAAYAQNVLKVAVPRVGVLNIGEEPEKGNSLALEVHTRLAGLAPGSGVGAPGRRLSWTFIGNVEGRAIFDGAADVVVVDGFAGNVFLKTAEGAVGMVKRVLQEEVRRVGFLAKAGALLMKGAFAGLKRRTDPAEYGGALLLGVDGVCVICHGSSRAYAVANAIRVAIEALRSDAIGLIRDTVQPAGGASGEPIEQGERTA
ncbi:MAG: phosphate acyltransferase PlsX [Cyanobacteria bacterium REEB65]|nr:phosphate acyltransferase PlsX [Cyanobacteria bacterium REEB65]